jgi:hypothetical protein
MMTGSSAIYLRAVGNGTKPFSLQLAGKQATKKTRYEGTELCCWHTAHHGSELFITGFSQTQHAKLKSLS